MCVCACVGSHTRAFVRREKQSGQVTVHRARDYKARRGRLRRRGILISKTCFYQFRTRFTVLRAMSCLDAVVEVGRHELVLTGDSRGTRNPVPPPIPPLDISTRRLPREFIGNVRSSAFLARENRRASKVTPRLRKERSALLRIARGIVFGWKGRCDPKSRDWIVAVNSRKNIVRRLSKRC